MRLRFLFSRFFAALSSPGFFLFSRGLSFDLIDFLISKATTKQKGGRAKNEERRKKERKKRDSTGLHPPILVHRPSTTGSDR